ncbi:hypothetical protein DNTS_029723, partial [Danionella cerebrum]
CTFDQSFAFGATLKMAERGSRSPEQPHGNYLSVWLTDVSGPSPVPKFLFEAMEKITEKILLERGTPKTNKLEQIKTLNLSRMALKSEDLPVLLLSKLCSLEQLDLSGNMLQKIPKGLHLPGLKTLNCSDNEMEDVLSLEALSNIEELKLEDNMYLTVNDEHKVIFLLPKLRKFNGKDIRSTANHIRHGSTEILSKRVIGVWEQSFNLPNTVEAKGLAAVEKSFVEAACTQIKYGPSSLSDYTRWRVEMIAKEYVKSLVGEEEDTPPAKISKTKTNNFAAKRITSPQKRIRNDTELNAEASPQKSSCLASRVLTETIPRKSTRIQPTPQKDTTAEPVSLKPLHVLQCHSRQDNPDDFKTQLWSCAFEPPLAECADDSRWARTVATCGGESLCVINCESGHVLKKYKVPEEEFFTLAWSTVQMSRSSGLTRPCNILAAGGKRGLVKLIHPRANLAFGEFRASRRAISILCFSSSNTSFLFTGTYENKIILWDIGALDEDYNFTVSKLLILETSSTPLHLSLLPSSPDKHLFSGCDNGLLVYDVQLSKNKLKRNEEMEIVFPVYKKKDKKNSYRTIDGMSFLSEEIVASKSHMQGSIYLWSWRETRGSWNSRKKEVPAVILAELQWSSYGYVACGDEQGRLWMYHITDSMKEHFKSGRTVSATEVLQWPSPVRAGKGALQGSSINSIAMDPDLQYLVALTEKNMAVIWKRQCR